MLHKNAILKNRPIVISGILLIVIPLFLFALHYRLASAFGINADFVVGQSDFVHGAANAAYSSSSSNYLPEGVASDGTHFFVADTFNNRVLVYNSTPSATNAPADVVIGQQDFTHNDGNQGLTNPGANTLNEPEAVATDGTRLFILDSGNDRVLIYNTIPTANNASADVEIGQPDMQTGTSHSTAADTFSFPQGISYDALSGKLIVADTFNNRVLIYNSVPVANNASADTVVGQVGFTQSTANQGVTANANTLSIPYAAVVIQNKLFIADNNNSRVLIFNTIPSTNNASADNVIGQTVMTSSSEIGGTTDHTMLSPEDVYWDGSHLLITDNGNHRVLIYNSIPVSNGATADGVVGQPNFTANTSGTTNSSLNAPNKIVVQNGTLFVADVNNSRIMGFGNYLSSTVATIVLGQSDFTSRQFNETAVPRNVGVNYAWGVATDGTRLFVSDCVNNRVLIYNSVPTSNNAPADVVIGQPDMGSGQSNQGLANATDKTLSCPSFLATDGKRLVVADGGNNRVLVYNPIPTTNDAKADVVIGQPSFSVSLSNQGQASASADTLNSPTGVSYDPLTGKLLVGDTNNNRILVFNSIPTKNNTSADIVVGQPDMHASLDNQGGTVAANTVSGPFNARIHDSKLFVSDSGNNRVLVFNSVPTSNNAPADVVIGQPTMGDNSANQGSSTAGNTLSFPTDTLWDGSKLLIQDDINNRILVYNSIPSSDNAFANDAIGQTNLTDSSSGITASTLNDPEGELAQAGTTLIVGDSSNNRVLGYNSFLTLPVPTPTPNPANTPNTNFPQGDFVSGPKAVFAMTQIGSTLYLGGTFTQLCDSSGSNCVARQGLGAIDVNTGQVTSWDPALHYSTNAEVDSFLVTNNTLYVGGFFDRVQNQPRGNLAAFDASSGALLSWDPQASDGVTTLEEYNNTLYIGGYFTSITQNTVSNPRNTLASFDTSTDSGELTTWSPPSDGAGVLKIKQNQGILYVGGYFFTIGCLSNSGCPSQGENRKLLAAFDPATGFLTSFNPILSTVGGFSSFTSVSSMAFCRNTFYIGGNFTGVNGTPINNLAALDTSTGNLALQWFPNPGPADVAGGNNIQEVFSLAIKDNQLYVGGDYFDIAGTHRMAVSSFDLSNNNSLNSWNITAPQFAIADVIYPTDNFIYVGGDFDAMGGTSSAKLVAQFDYTSNPPATDVCAAQSPTVTASTSNTSSSSQGSVNPPVCSSQKPGEPSNITMVAGPGVGQVTISWTAPPGPVTDYSITYSTDPNTRMWGVVSTGNVTTYTVSDLPVNQTYYFWVNAVNGCMPGDAVDPGIHLGSTVASSFAVQNPNSVITVTPGVPSIPNPSLAPTGPRDTVKLGVIGIIMAVLGAALILAL